jgi:hypothetical protein
VVPRPPSRARLSGRSLRPLGQGQEPGALACEIRAENRAGTSVHGIASAAVSAQPGGEAQQWSDRASPTETAKRGADGRSVQPQLIRFGEAALIGRVVAIDLQPRNASDERIARPGGSISGTFVAFQQRLSLLVRVKPRLRWATCRHCGNLSPICRQSDVILRPRSSVTGNRR